MSRGYKGALLTETEDTAGEGKGSESDENRTCRASKLVHPSLDGPETAKNGASGHCCIDDVNSRICVILRAGRNVVRMTVEVTCQCTRLACRAVFVSPS